MGTEVYDGLLNPLLHGRLNPSLQSHHNHLNPICSNKERKSQ